MTDTFTAEKRSEVMRAIKGKDTKPEMVVRSVAHRLGYRFRLHVRELTGCPDLVFPRRRKVIFVHGCFWHGHAGCKEGRLPKSNVDYWTQKIGRNKKRDASVIRKLRKEGWGVKIVWECQTGRPDSLSKIIEKFMI